MKKLSALLLAGIMAAGLFVLAACGGSSKVKVSVFYYSNADVYISTVRSELDKKFKEMKNVEFQNYDGNNSQTTQTEQINTAITQGTDVIIVNIVNTSSEDAAKGIVQLAKDADIPVIFFNREVADSVIKSYDKCAFVGTRAEDAGHLQGEMVADFLLKDYSKYDLNGDGEISYVMLKGEDGNKEAEYRTKYGVEDANKKLEAAGKKPLKYYNPDAPEKFLLDKDGTWSASNAKELIDTVLSIYNDTNKNMIELVIANNDGMAEGAISALQSVGYNGEDTTKVIPVFGVDATASAQEYIKKGQMAGTVKQDAEAMAKCIALLAGNVAEGKEILAGTDSYKIDENVDKIRIPYSPFTK